MYVCGLRRGPGLVFWGASPRDPWGAWEDAKHGKGSRERSTRWQGAHRRPCLGCGVGHGDGTASGAGSSPARLGNGTFVRKAQEGGTIAGRGGGAFSGPVVKFVNQL